MNIIVFGPTGGTGRAVIAKLLADGHTVTAFARDPSKLSASPGLTVVKGDAMSPADVKRAIPGHDAVIISLGNPQLPIAISLGARRTTPADICEMGTRNIVGALGPGSPVRIIAVTAFGVGDTRDKMSVTFKIVYKLLMRELMVDKEHQEAVLKASDLDYVSGAAGRADGCSRLGRLGRQRKGRNAKDAHVSQGRGRVHRGRNREPVAIIGKPSPFRANASRISQRRLCPYRGLQNYLYIYL